MESVKLVEVTRGETVESLHRGVIVVIDSHGKKIASAGDSTYYTFIRSAAKPIQALPVLEKGAAEHFGFSVEEIALIMSSHSGEQGHVHIGLQLMEKIGLEAKYLQCGTHPPLHKATAKELATRGQAPSVFHCTCSGKHAGMLALAKYLKLSLDDYFQLKHQVQQMMLNTIAELADLNIASIEVGTDGCGVPVFAMPVERMAYIYARWANPSDLSVERIKACNILQEAITTYPEVVAGTGRLASDLMKVTDKKLLAKDGNEGIFCIGLPSKGWGIAIKIEDGNTRAVGPVVIETLRQLGILTEDEYKKLSSYSRIELKNYRGELIGEARPVFKLNFKEEEKQKWILQKYSARS
ncbi:MAG: L-asparaginase [Firmicutes bacterium HGW-Firmicutes-12]|jgi:L-asparaginase II|nr:MAG: L-asparaginase [Firmicutes bacterium HGW-Firmicutes-12]